MDEISGFWAGAQDFASKLDLRQLAVDAGGFDALEDASEAELLALGVAPPIAYAWIRATPRFTRGIALTLVDARYPVPLREIPSPPPVICVEGDLACFDEVGVAVVGTRACTAYGVAIARRLGADLAANGVPVISGLARGIDAHAHRGALSTGRTVAVLGHGLAHTAPASNRALRDAIVERGGAIVSAWPDGFAPHPGTFPVRNQWISGLSKAVVVVEAPTRSGALITATEAAAQGRDVYIVPGPLGATASRGCLETLRDTNARCVADLDELVAYLSRRQLARTVEWLNALFNGGTVEDAARVAGWSIAETLAELSRLELSGRVVRLPGQRYAPAGSAV